MWRRLLVLTCLSNFFNCCCYFCIKFSPVCFRRDSSQVFLTSSSMDKIKNTGQTSKKDCGTNWKQTDWIVWISILTFTAPATEHYLQKRNYISKQIGILWDQSAEKYYTQNFKCRKDLLYLCLGLQLYNYLLQIFWQFTFRTDQVDTDGHSQKVNHVFNKKPDFFRIVFINQIGNFSFGYHCMIAKII